MFVEYQRHVNSLLGTCVPINVFLMILITALDVVSVSYSTFRFCVVSLGPLR